MPFDLKTAVTLASRRYLGPTVTVALLLVGGMTYVWSEYKELNKERKSFTDEIILSEKARAAAAIALVEKKADLEKREFILQQVEAQNNDQLAALKQRAVQYEAAFVQLQQSKSSTDMGQRQKEAEEKIQRLMSEFTALGVNLNDQVRCDDTAGVTRFNVAKAKYTEAYTLAEANGLTKKYGHFFFQNGQQIYSACQK